MRFSLNTALFFLAVITVSVSFSSCELMALAEGGEVAAMGDFAEVGAAEGMGGEFIARESLSTGEVMGMERGATEFIIDEPKLMTHIEELDMRRGPTGKSELFLKNKGDAIAEIVDRRYIKPIRSGNLYEVHNTIFRVEGDNLVLRSSRGFSGNNVIRTLNHGSFIEELNESDGWYHVRVYDNGSFVDGFIPVAGVLTTVLVGKDNKPVPERKKDVDYKTLVNTCFINLAKSTEVAVFLADENNNFSMTLSSAIAKIYSDTGYHANFSLFKPEFAATQGFEDLFNGNTAWAKNIPLNKYVDYIVMGKVNSSYRDGTITVGTRTCSSTVEVHIFSTKDKVMVNAFTLNLNGIGFKDEEAQRTVDMHIVSRYKREHSTI